MQIDFLAAQGFSKDTIENWKAGGKGALLPLQVEAITRTRLLTGGNVAVFAPTSSGKTFVAEMAAVRHLERGGKAIFLVPTKALAEEQYRYLDGAYSALGARVVIATRERTLHDRSILRGEFDFAVMVYEKLKAFLTLAPELLQRIAMVAVDELQILGESGRGELVDLLLTQVANAQPKIQVVCMSAVLADHLRLASWLNAEPLVWAERPTELREGVFCLADSTFYYSESNSGTESHEPLVVTSDGVYRYSILSDPQSFQYPAVEVLCSQMVSRGEQVLVFVPTRELSRRWAYRLANALPAMRDGNECDAATLREAEESHSRELMERCLQNGVAFHNADLGAELRTLVEEQFQAGAIRVLVATSTLAQGVNLHCRNVISVPLMLDPRLTAFATRPAFVPLSVQRFRNQGGRAGRLCSGEPFGRSIVIAEDDAELRRMMNQYVRADVEQLETRIGAGALERLVLDLVHCGRATCVDALHRALLKTYCGASYWQAKPEELSKALDAALCRLMDAQLLQQRGADARLTTTGLGQIAAAFGLQAATVRMFANHCATHGGCSELEVLALCAFCPDGEIFPVVVSQSEAQEQFYPRLLKIRYGSLIYALPEDVRALLAPDGGFANGAMCALKKMFLADAWTSAEPTHAIEEQFKTFAGTFANLGAHFSWLSQALASCMATLGLERRMVEQVNEMADRLAWGTTSAGLAVARLGVRGMTRTHVQQLVHAGYDTIESLAQLSAETLGDLLPVRVVEPLVREASRLAKSSERTHSADWFTIVEQWNVPKDEKPAHPQQLEVPGREEAREVVQPISDPQFPRAVDVPMVAESAADYLVSSPELVIDPASPGEVEFQGQRLRLTPKPFELLLLLARHPGRTIPYSEIDGALWPDSKVEAQQRSAHKTALVRALASVCGRDVAESLVVNVARFGIRFDLEESRISVGKLRTQSRSNWASSNRNTARPSAVPVA